MDLLKQWEAIQKKPRSPFIPGSVENVFFYNEMCGKNEDGTIPVIVKLESEESKKKKSIN